jgi:hypothetical protein
MDFSKKLKKKEGQPLYWNPMFGVECSAGERHFLIALGFLLESVVRGDRHLRGLEICEYYLALLGLLY